MYVVSEATRNSLRGCKLQKFSGGACPQTPLVWVWCRAREFPPSTKKSCDYRIAGNFCGVQFSRFSQISGYPRE
jgi:hypothetical protein